MKKEGNFLNLNLNLTLNILRDVVTDFKVFSLDPEEDLGVVWLIYEV